MTWHGLRPFLDTFKPRFDKLRTWSARQDYLYTSTKSRMDAEDNTTHLVYAIEVSVWI
jgi:hypothetical protein